MSMTKNTAPALPAADSGTDPAPSPHEGGGNGLLWVLVAVAVLFAFLRPRAPMDWLKLVDWQTVGALAGLLAITQGVEKSGMLQSAAQRLLARTTNLRQLALLLTATAAVLSALVTNDVSLFLLVPLTRVLATQAHLPLARLVVLQALAVNAGSALTPIGNPQNLYLWHRSGESFGGFMLMMAPTVLVMLFWLFVAVWLLVPRTAIALKPAAEAAPVNPRLLALSGVLFVGFVVALDRHWLLAGLAVVFVAYLLFQRRVLLGVDWALLAIIALMFVDLRQLAELPAVASLVGQWPIARRLARVPGGHRHLAVHQQRAGHHPAGPLRARPARAGGGRERGRLRLRAGLAGQPHRAAAGQGAARAARVPSHRHSLPDRVRGIRGAAAPRLTRAFRLHKHSHKGHPNATFPRIP
jgi:hypothetical protein